MYQGLQTFSESSIMLINCKLNSVGIVTLDVTLYRVCPAQALRGSDTLNNLIHWSSLHSIPLLRQLFRQNRSAIFLIACLGKQGKDYEKHDITKASSAVFMIFNSAGSTTWLERLRTVPTGAYRCLLIQSIVSTNYVQRYFCPGL